MFRSSLHDNQPKHKCIAVAICSPYQNQKIILLSPTCSKQPPRTITSSKSGISDNAMSNTVRPVVFFWLLVPGSAGGGRGSISLSPFNSLWRLLLSLPDAAPGRLSAYRRSRICFWKCPFRREISQTLCKRKEDSNKESMVLQWQRLQPNQRGSEASESDAWRQELLLFALFLRRKSNAGRAIKWALIMVWRRRSLFFSNFVKNVLYDF